MIKKIKNLITIKRIFILILVISLGVNAFFFGRQWLQRDRQRNFNAGIIWVFEQGKRLGQVSYTTSEGEIIRLIVPIKIEE